MSTSVYSPIYHSGVPVPDRKALKKSGVHDLSGIPGAPINNHKYKLRIDPANVNNNIHGRQLNFGN